MKSPERRAGAMLNESGGMPVPSRRRSARMALPAGVRSAKDRAVVRRAHSCTM